MLSDRKYIMRDLVNGLKTEAKTCESCAKELDRIVLLKGHERFPREEIRTLTDEVTKPQWDKLRHDWHCVCRQCSIVLTAQANQVADLHGFYRWLLNAPSISATSVREYSTRLLRLMQRLTRDQMNDAVLKGTLDDYVGDILSASDARNYNRVILKYREYCLSNRPK